MTRFLRRNPSLLHVFSALALVGVCVVVAAGCGSGDDVGDDSDTTFAYQDHIRQICSDLDIALADARDNHRYYNEKIQGALAAREAALAAIQSETPPAGLEESHGDLLETQSEAVDLARELVGSLYPTSADIWYGTPLDGSQAEIFVNLAAANDLARAAWSELGAENCG